MALAAIPNHFVTGRNGGSCSWQRPADRAPFTCVSRRSHTASGSAARLRDYRRRPGSLSLTPHPGSLRLRQSSSPSLSPAGCALLFEPSAQQPIVVGALIGKRDPVAVGCLNQRQAVLARQSRLVVAGAVHAEVKFREADRADLACQGGRARVFEFCSGLVDLVVRRTSPWRGVVTEDAAAFSIFFPMDQGSSVVGPNGGGNGSPGPTAAGGGAGTGIPSPGRTGALENPAGCI
jgi:hypothetical protein